MNMLYGHGEKSVAELHEPCVFVLDAAGSTPEDVAILRDDPEGVKELEDTIVSAHDYPKWAGDVYEHPAFRAMQTLGCSACIASEVCPVQARLGARPSEDLQRRETILLMREAACVSPDWLAAGRLAVTDMAVLPLLGLVGNPEDNDMLRKAVDEEGVLEVDLDVAQEALAGVRHVKGPEVYTRDALPELTRISRIGGSDPLRGDIVETASGHRLAVIDASGNVDFQSSHLPWRETQILCAKLLLRMSQLDASGEPQILTPDQTMQKKLHFDTGRGALFELRMSAKNRLYFTLNTEANPIRIVLLGSHGGDSATQVSFLENLMRTA